MTGIRSAPRERCYLCGSPGQPLYKDLSDRIFSAPGVWSLAQCQDRDCGLIWLDPMPVPEDLGKAYETYYTHDSQELSEERRNSRLRHVYHSLIGQLDAITGVRRARTELETMFLNGDRSGTLLEVGCGSGEFLSMMQARGWDVSGLDFDPGAVASANRRGLSVQCGDLLDLSYPASHFDHVVMSHVIEHLSDPLTTLQECRRILKPGGRVVLITPNTASWGHAEFGADWRDLDPPRHLFLFSPRSLASLASRAGFTVTRAISSAGRAHAIFAGCLEIRRSGRHDMQSDKLRPALALRSKMLQYAEHLSLPLRPLAGEEAVVIATKPAEVQRAG